MISTQSKMAKSAAIAFVGLGAVAVAAGCSKKESTPAPTSAAPTSAAPTTAAPAPAGVPAPPAGSTPLGGDNYKTSQTPVQVKNYYVSALQGSGYTILKNTQGGGGGGGYGGSGAGTIGQNGSMFVGMGAGGEAGHTTYFSVCSGTSQAAVNGCYDNENHGNSGAS